MLTILQKHPLDKHHRSPLPTSSPYAPAKRTADWLDSLPYHNKPDRRRSATDSGRSSREASHRQGERSTPSFTKRIDSQRSSCSREDDRHTRRRSDRKDRELRSGKESTRRRDGKRDDDGDGKGREKSGKGRRVKRDRNWDRSSEGDGRRDSFGNGREKRRS